MPGASFILRDRLQRLDAVDLAALPVAVFELARARRPLHRLDPAGFKAPAAAQGVPSPAERVTIGRIARAIARAARIVPWRSDCLVRAEAARHWLVRSGLTSEIRLGARKGPTGGVETHAWLVCRGEVVTGGDIRDYAPFG